MSEDGGFSRGDTATIDSLLRAVAAAPPVAPPVPFAGTARFELVRRLGQGGFGTVYEAIDREAGQRVALKVLRRVTPESLFRFKNEFRSLPDIEHPNVVRIDRLHRDGDHWFFTMELVEGAHFTSWVRANPDQLVAAFRQLVQAVAHLHAVGIVHRDLKPSNVLVADGRVVVVDFGLAALAVANPDVPGAGGTPLYMAPEQVEGRAVVPASDWYALGVMLYEALAGRPRERWAPILRSRQRPGRARSSSAGSPSSHA